MSTAMQTTNSLAIKPPSVPTTFELSAERFELLRRTIAKDLTNDEFELFAARCRQTQLDPFSNQICAVKRWSSQAKGDVMTIQVQIHGLRLIADRTGNYAPGKASTYTYNDKGDVATATAYVMKYAHGTWHEVSETADWDEFAQTYKDKQSGEGRLMGLWATKPKVMLSKCAESLALRKAFPQETSGLYTDDEMPPVDGRTGEIIDVTPQPAPSPVPELSDPPATGEVVQPSQHQKRKNAALRQLKKDPAWQDADLVKLYDEKWDVPFERLTDGEQVSVCEYFESFS